MLPQGGACELDIVVQVDFGQIMMALGGKSSAFGKKAIHYNNEKYEKSLGGTVETAAASVTQGHTA